MRLLREIGHWKHLIGHGSNESIHRWNADCGKCKKDVTWSTTKPLTPNPQLSDMPSLVNVSTDPSYSVTSTFERTRIAFTAPPAASFGSAHFRFGPLSVCIHFGFIQRSGRDHVQRSSRDHVQRSSRDLIERSRCESQARVSSA